MRELTIETKTYTELINRLEEVKDAIKKQNYGIAMDVLCKPYPEFQVTTQSEAKEGEGARIRACIEMCLTDANEQRFEDYNTSLKECLDWFEKQGEQKPKFRVGDTIKCKHDNRQFTIKSVDLDKGTYTYTQEGCGNDIDYADEEFELVEQTSSWSKEDEENVNELIAYFIADMSLNHTEEDIVNWLKSLKDKYDWKPSDEQMKFLWKYAEQNNYDGSILASLHQDLKKLKGE